MVDTSSLAQEKIFAQEQSKLSIPVVSPKRRRSLKKTPERLELKIDRPKIMGDTLRRALNKFNPNQECEYFSGSPCTVPLFTTLLLPIMMQLNRAQSMNNMYNWFCEHKDEIQQQLPCGHELVSVLQKQEEPANFFGRILSQVYIAGYEHFLWQCRQWQKQFIYQDVFEGYKADRLRFELTQDVNAQLANFDHLYQLSLSDRGVVWLKEPEESLKPLLPLSFGRLLQTFDNQGIVIKIKLKSIAASTIERLFVNQAHIIIDLEEQSSPELYRMANQALQDNTPYHYNCERHALALDLIPSTALKEPLERARMALSGWICRVYYPEGVKLALLWWQSEPLAYVEQIAEAFYYLHHPAPCFYWSNMPQDYSRLNLTPSEQRLGRNCVLMGRFIRHVLNYEQSCTSLYRRQIQESGSLSKERLQGYLNNVSACSASLLRYMSNRS